MYIQSDAVISADTLYRYRLTRRWADGPEVTFIMLNPSTADALDDDATIRKCVGFAKKWRMGALNVGNLFALRATQPAALYSAIDPIGPDNHDYLIEICERAQKSGGEVICAWGANGAYMGQDQLFISWMTMRSIKLKCLKLTKVSLMPQHPLYLAYDHGPIVF